MVTPWRRTETVTSFCRIFTAHDGPKLQDYGEAITLANRVENEGEPLPGLDVTSSYNWPPYHKPFTASRTPLAIQLNVV